MKVRRRTVLLALGAAVAAPAGLASYRWWRYVRRGDPSPLLLAILDRHLGRIRISDESKALFVADLLKSMGDGQRKRAARLGLGAEIYEMVGWLPARASSAEYFRRLEDLVITRFLLGSDMLDKGGDAREAKYFSRPRTCIGMSVKLF